MIYEKREDPAPLVVIFGATGDLAQKKLFPALNVLRAAGAISSECSILAVSRRELDSEGFRNFLRERNPDFKEEFLRQVEYVRADIGDTEGCRRLYTFIRESESGFQGIRTKLFHISLPPKLSEEALRQMRDGGFGEFSKSGKCYALLEKPIGLDGTSASTMNNLVEEIFGEANVFRVDHYLMKRSLRMFSGDDFRMFLKDIRPENIATFSAFQYETDDVEKRFDFYDGVGALRDVGQNHLLMLFAVFAEVFSGGKPSDSFARNKFLSALTPGLLAPRLSRGQYEGYGSDRKKSETETYFRVETEFSVEGYNKTKVFFESGKALNKKLTEVEVSFRQPICFLLPDGKSKFASRIVFRVQTDPSFLILSDDGSVASRASVADYPKHSAIFDSYEQVYFEAIQGDPSWFPSRAEIETSWRFVDPIMKIFPVLPLIRYKRGSVPPFNTMGDKRG